MCQRRWIWFTLIFGIIAAPLSTGAGQKGKPSAPLRVATRTCLFLDDYFIAEQSGLKRTWYQGKPHPKAILEETEPWDHWISLYGGCFYDPVGRVYRMYYQSSHYPSGVKGLSFRQDTCYAESKDAIHWVKPKLGVVDYKGSKDNNIMFFCAGACNAFLDPSAKDNKGRIKAQLFFTVKDSLYDNARGLHLIQSADGIHWEDFGGISGPKFANPAEAGFVDSICLGWDPLMNSYIGYWRCFSKHKLSERNSGKRRAIGITWSDRLTRGWSPVVLTVQADERDDAHAGRLSKDPAKPEWAELYVTPQIVYGNHYLNFITIFELPDGKDANGGGGLQLAFSNDGLHWTRPEPRRNAIENSDDPELFPNFAQQNPLLDMGDEMWLFYSENNGTHGVMPFARSRGRIRAAVWRKDGFTSLDAVGSATLTTKPLAHAGKELLVNFKTRPGGSVRVGLLDEKGDPIGQFNLGDGKPLTGEGTARKVEWVGGADFSRRVGNKPVRLRFELEKAQLFSFRFAP